MNGKDGDFKTVDGTLDRYNTLVLSQSKICQIVYIIEICNGLENQT
jgi:hypothetical protein